VDVVLCDPYDWPELEDASFDAVVCGQTLEHVEYPWRLLTSISAKLKPGGLAMVVAPSRGPEHRYPRDCYRFLPDGLRALAKLAGLAPVEVGHLAGEGAFTDGSGQWGDCYGIFSKPNRRDLPPLEAASSGGPSESASAGEDRPDGYFEFERRDEGLPAGPSPRHRGARTRPHPQCSARWNGCGLDLEPMTGREGWAFAIRREAAVQVGAIPPGIVTYFGDDYVFAGVREHGKGVARIRSLGVYHHMNAMIRALGIATDCSSDLRAWHGFLAERMRTSPRPRVWADAIARCYGMSASAGHREAAVERG